MRGFLSLSDYVSIFSVLDWWGSISEFGFQPKVIQPILGHSEGGMDFHEADPRVANNPQLGAGKVRLNSAAMAGQTSWPSADQARVPLVDGC